MHSNQFFYYQNDKLRPLKLSQEVPQATTVVLCIFLRPQRDRLKRVDGRIPPKTENAMMRDN